MGRNLAAFVVVIVFLFVGSAFAQQPTPASSPASQTQAPSRTAWQKDWEETLAAAKKEGPVVVYHAPMADAKEALQTSFKQKYGLDVDFVTGRTGDLLSRIKSERAAGRYSVDMMLCGLTSVFSIVLPSNITTAFEPLLILPEVTDGTKWRTGKLSFVDKGRTVLAMSLTALPYTIINTELVKEGELVSTEDVMSPKWQGKIVINDPTIPGPGAEWLTYLMLVVYGEERGAEYVKRLVKQQPSMIRDERLSVEWVARGKYPIGLGLEPSEVLKMAKIGAPIKLIGMKEGKPLGSGPLNMMVLDKAPHPNATKVLANWLLSREAGEIFSKCSGYLSARLDVSTADFDPVIVPGSTDTLPENAEEYFLRRANVLKVAADLFKELKQ